MRPETHRRFAACLKAEREALLAGDFVTLDALADERSALLAGVTGVLDEALVADIDRNQALLAAAADGIASARRRVWDLKRAVAGLGTYGADGRRAGDVSSRFDTGRTLAKKF